MPFAWGSFDCALFGADAVLALTGEDPASEYRGTYHTAIGASAALQRVCGGGLVEAIERNGWRECCPALARRGDVGITNSPQGPAVAVCLGKVWAVPRVGSGLTKICRHDITRAWRIG